ncbi:MAG TPA: lyase family protein [Bradyrhizobium sp.]|nr:lyase family protein [Bradyrhizobium sp.]
MANDQQSGTGRLAGGKSPSYQRAVNEPETRASRFTARYMVASDIAYVLSAAELGATPRNIATGLLQALLPLYDDIGAVDTTRPLGDVVAQRESWVMEKAGKENTAWLHLGRNRGESLRGFLPRMFFRQTLHEAAQANAKLISNLVARAKPVLESISPNYHHLQHSGLTTLGEYLLSWAVAFERHIERFAQADRRLDKAPPPFGGRKILDDLYRDVSKRLGFSHRARLRRDGIWVHDQFTEPFFALSLLSVDLARLAQDLRVWMTPEFGFFELADEHAGGSSALPHAKVPFGLQAVIGGSIMASTRLAGEMTAASNLSEGSEPIYQSGTLYGMAQDIVAFTRYMGDVIEKGKFNLDEMRRKATFDYAGSSEAHDRLVYDFGVPFRTGHRLLGALVRNHYMKEPPVDLNQMLEQELGRPFSIDQNEIMDIVLVKKIWPSMFDFPMLRETLGEYEKKAADAMEKSSGESAVERAIDRLLTEARDFLAKS